jgi:uncharacterized protein
MQPIIDTIPLVHLASGDRLALQVYKFTGIQPGPKVYIQANLHGSEIAGNAVIHHLVERLTALGMDQLAGEIWLVPTCNPMGVNMRTHHFATGRFNPYDGKDWNRIFWDYEKAEKDLETFAKTCLDLDQLTIEKTYRQRMRDRFAEQHTAIGSSVGMSYSDRFRHALQTLCQDASYVIDLHSSTNLGIDYVYYFKGREPGAALFQLGLAALMNEYDGDAFDEAFMKPWLALETALAKLGRTLQFEVEAYTLELGSGMQMNPTSIANGIRGVTHFLVKKGILPDAFLPTEAFTIETRFTEHTQMKRYFAPMGGMIQNRVALGEMVQPGQRLYTLLSFNKEGKPPELIEVLTDQSGLVFDLSTSQVVNQGEYVLGLV